jgi:hypothetical protein
MKIGGLLEEKSTAYVSAIILGPHLLGDLQSLIQHWRK